MSFSSLHRALGVQPSALSFEMLEAAVEQQVTEQTDLDWKEKLPDSRDQDAKEEFAKDIAAMANVGGGLIVFGVREDKRSAATELLDIGPWTDQEARRLRQLAHMLIQPPVQGLEFTPLSRAAVTVMVLSVPASSEVPHFQVRRDFFRAPRRYGAQTVDMSEREIEIAYRHRLEGRLLRQKTLQGMQDDVLLGMNNERIWMTAVGMPSNPRPLSLGRLERSIMQSVVQIMMNNPYLARQMSNRFEYLSFRPRIGYRRWRSVIDMENDELYGAIEVYDDGSFALTFAPLDLPDEFESGIDLHPADVHSFPAYAVRLLEAVTSSLGIQGSYEMQLNLINSSKPMHIRTYRNQGLVPRDRTSGIYRFHPVRALHDGSADEASNLETVHSLALDLLNQGGITRVDPLYLREMEAPEPH